MRLFFAYTSAILELPIVAAEVSKMCRKRVNRRTPKSPKTGYFAGYWFEPPGPIVIRMRLEKTHISAMLEFAIMVCERSKKAENVLVGEPKNH
jgi:hypothetical protein